MFFPNFLLPLIYIFQTSLYFSPSSILLHTRLHCSQAHKLTRPLAPHLHCPITTTAPPPCPPKSHRNKNPNTADQPRSQQEKKKPQINPNQNPDIATTAAARSTFPPLLINPYQPIIGENHSITTGKKKKADRRFLHCDV